MNEAESCEGATLHCVCPKLIMLTIFRGPSGVGEGSTGRSTMKYHKTEAGRSKFWLVGKGMKLKCCLPSEVLTKPHKTSNLTQGKSPRMRCGGNLSGGENKQKTTKPCDGNNQWTMMMLAVLCDGLGGMGLGNNQ